MNWENALINAITNPQELLESLALENSWLPQAQAAAKLFPLRVTRSFVARMQKNNRYDPLLLQVLPVIEEFQDPEGYQTDPLNETNANPIPGLLHKYQNRVLLTLVGTCGINCRFCFRRHFPYENNNPGTIGWQKALDYIANDVQINEVILSGGDPLVANDKMLQNLSEKLALIPHIKRLRIHTRMPIVLPERIDTGFLTWAKNVKQKIIVIVHCNHPQELNTEVSEAMLAMQQANIVLFNQSVLLKGVNDCPEVLSQLSERLFEMGVQPYYLHLLDKVKGAAHFDLPHERALLIHLEMSRRLSGYLVPKLVYEQAGAPAKIGLNATSFFTD